MRETLSPSLCTETRKQLGAYTQAKLSLLRAQRVYAHLSRCSSCRAVSRGETQAPRTSGVGSRTLRAGALATVGTALFFLYGIYFPALQASTPSIASAHPAHAPISGFAGRPGGGYYVRLYVTDLAATEGAVARLLKESPVLQSKGPYNGRYCFRAMPEQFSLLMGRLMEMGNSETIPVGNRPWWFEDAPTPDACSVMLDLISSPSR